MANETWDKKWASFVETQLAAERQDTATMVFLDGKLLVASRRGIPADYVWVKGETVPRFKEPVRMGSTISVVGCTGQLGPGLIRHDFRIIQKVTPGAEKVPVVPFMEP